MARPTKKPTKRRSKSNKKPTTKPKTTRASRAPKQAPPVRHHEPDFEPFAVTADEIAGLDAHQFRRFMRDLIRNEVAACKGSASFIDNPGDGADQGQDAETQRTSTDPTTEKFIPVGATVWQYKAEQRAPTESELTEEIAKPRPKSTLKAGGHYRFVAQQPANNESRVNALLRKVAARKRHDPEKVAFHAQATLAERARRYPSLALLSFLRRPPLEFLHPFSWLAGQKQHAGNFDIESRDQPLSQLTDHLKTGIRPTHVRVVGPAGVGKTRLVVQAISQLELGPCTVYAPSATTSGFNAFFKWCEEKKARLILLVDECDEATAMKTRGTIVEHDLPIALVTINKVEDRELEAMSHDLRIHLDPMSEADIGRILERSTRLDKSQIRAIAHITGGFVKLATVVAEAVSREQRSGYDPSALITIDTIQTAVSSLLAAPADALRWLGTVALFDEIRIDSTAPGSDVATLADFAHVSIEDACDWNTTAITEQILSNKGDRVFVTPALLAVLLARRIMRSRAHDLAPWLRGLPRRLQEAFASQVGQLRYSSDGLELARELIGIDGPFGDLLAERQPWAREAFLALGSVAKTEALNRLEEWVRDVGTAAEDLSSDRNLERLLFRLMWRPEHFARSFRLLVRGLNAAADPSRSGLHRVMTGSLQVTLANSRAPFPDRFAVAARTVRDPSLRPETRRLVLRALAAGVGNGTGDGYSPEDVDASGREYWHATTYGELWECVRSVAKLLVETLDDPDEPLRKEAAANLIDHAAEFVRNRAFEPLLAAIPRILSIDPRVGTLREELERCIAFDQVPEDIDRSVRAAIDALPQDLGARIRVLVEGWPLFQDREERRLPERPDPVLVAAEIIASPERPKVVEQLFQPWAKNAGDLLISLAKSPHAKELWPEILAAARRSGETWGAGLFLAVAHDAGATMFQRVASDLLGSAESYDVGLGAEAITRMEASDDDVLELSRAVAKGRAKPAALRYAILGRWTERRSSKVIADLIRATALQDDGGLNLALALVHAAEKNLALTDAEVIDLLSRSMFDVHGHDAWLWKEVGGGLAKRAPTALGVALIKIIGEYAEERENRYKRWSMDEVSAVLSQCIDADPALAPQLLKLWDRAPHFVESEGTGALLKHLDASTLGDWAIDERRQRALAHIVVAGSTTTTDSLLERFGADSAFAIALRDQLYPRSWSGSLASLLKSRADQARTWSADSGRTHEFREWARNAASWLDDAAERARPYDD